MCDYIDKSSIIKNSKYEHIKVYKNVCVNNCILGYNCSIGDDTTIERTTTENSVVVNRRSYINDSYIGKFSYSGINTTMNWTKLGRFCSLARNVDIGGFDHDYKKVTTMPLFRFQQNINGGEITKHNKHNEYCTIGNDVWIAAGAIVLHKVKIGDGSIVGAGAVVTKDVPPYAIVAGVPAKIIGYRFNDKYIDELLKIQWWNWPDDIIIKNFNIIVDNDVDDATIDKLKKIQSEM